MTNNERTTVITCPHAKGLSVCPECGSMIPDYCMKRDEPEAREPPVTQKPFKDPYGIVTGPREESTEGLPEVPATVAPEVQPEAVQEAPTRPVEDAPKAVPEPPRRGRKKRGGS